MTESYSIFKRSNGIYYAQILISETGKSIQKSTGKRTRKEAQSVVLEWYKNGLLLPEHGNIKLTEHQRAISAEKINFFNNLRTMDFDEKDVSEIIKILLDRHIAASIVVSNSQESMNAMDYLINFWDFDNSLYVKEKLRQGQTIQRNYCDNMITRIKTYWTSHLENKLLGDIRRNDLKEIFEDEKVSKLAPKTINGILNAVTIALRWAFNNDIIHSNCFDGIIRCSQKSKKREVLTMEQVYTVFDAEWDNDSAKLANLLACYTGMRQGEIAGLRLEDIGVDRLYVRHSWNKYEGLKSCKNGEEREVPITPKLRDMLLAQAALNPYDEGLKGFVFFGLLPEQPTDPKNWLKYLRRVLEEIGYSDPEKICFHAWRHLWCSRVSDLIHDKRVIMSISGHKTETMLDHYAEHIETDSAIDKMKVITEHLFLPMVDEVSNDKITYEITDAEIVKDCVQDYTKVSA